MVRGQKRKNSVIFHKIQRFVLSLKNEYKFVQQNFSPRPFTSNDPSGLSWDPLDGPDP